LRNTIVAGNFGLAGTVPDVQGSFTSQGHNLIGSGDVATGFGATGDQVGTAAAPINAKLDNLADNGGPTQTRALLFGSPAIDAGDDCVCGLSSPTVLTDQRGIARPQANHVDIGAFEMQAFGVTKTADTNGTCLPGDCSLREAINAANAGPQLERMIVFNIPGSDSGCDANGVCTIAPLSNLPALTNPILIDGYSQSGASVNTKHLDQGDDAVLKIVIDGTNDAAVTPRGIDLEPNAAGAQFPKFVNPWFGNQSLR